MEFALPITEADTCRKYVEKKLYSAGWSDDQIREQKTFTDGRIVTIGDKARRKPQKRADYLLSYRRDFTIAVVEAKAAYKNAADGLQQAKEYAAILALDFAFSTNGHEIVEHDFLTGVDSPLLEFPTPDELWNRLSGAQGITADVESKLLTPYYHEAGRSMRYYQQIAINRTVQAILQGKRRVLLTMATGTGKTPVAFQICWKLWNARWNLRGEHRKPRMLYLADRNILVDYPKDQHFAPFGDARHRIQGEASMSREMYFSTYQSIASDERRPGLYREYARDYFDLIIIDECHRGSAADEGNWREILEYFEPATQLGMTATPLRRENKDTYEYFGNPIYTYSLKQGIEDGFLAPYRVHRIVTSVDATGWRPTQGEVDRYMREVPDAEYTTSDFERLVALKGRTEAIAKHVTDFLKQTDRFAKTIIFCVDQEHAEAMRLAVNNLNADLVRQHPDYVCRIVSDEGDVGRGHLSKFQDVETSTPTIVTTSQLLTTGVDIPTCKNIVLARVIKSMTDFKQIIGRGTRVRDDYGKLFFNILDFTGSTRLFADPEFDGEPALITEIRLDEEGNVIEQSQEVPEAEQEALQEAEAAEPDLDITDDSEGERRKYYVDQGAVEIVGHIVYELDSGGKQLRVVKFTDYTGDAVRSMYPSAADLRSGWSRAEERATILAALEERGIDAAELAASTGQPDADPFDLLCYLAYNAPIRTRRERAERVRKDSNDLFERFGPEARQILNELLDKYIEHGTAQFKLPDVLYLPPISEHGNVVEIARKFDGADALAKAVEELQNALYAA
jgi:type I restriction enzyme R subunit